jgi:hypothetical protein
MAIIEVAARDITAATPSSARARSEFQNEGMKGLLQVWRSLLETILQSARENNRKTLHIGHRGINRSNYKPFVISVLI